MSQFQETQTAQSQLEQGLLTPLLKILRQSSYYTLLCVFIIRMLNPKSFEWADVLVIFAACFIGFSLITFFRLLLVAGKYRKPFKPGSRDKQSAV